MAQLDHLSIFALASRIDWLEEQFLATHRREYYEAWQQCDAERKRRLALLTEKEPKQCAQS